MGDEVWSKLSRRRVGKVGMDNWFQMALNLCKGGKDWPSMSLKWRQPIRNVILD